jgi:hypothetical protein
MVVEATDTSATRLTTLNAIASDGWGASPLVLRAGGTLYSNGALGGCDNDGGRPIADLEGALNRPGAYYKLVNGSEGQS